MSTKADQLQELERQITSDEVCLELKVGATQLVFGDGSPDAEIVFIGEAPGKNEDIQGKPFVGAAGKFLDEMLATIKLERKDIYITNIVKYRPPNNRDPLPEEKKAFLPYLQSQLEIIQPKIVVTLGRHSTNCFLPDLQISKCHGEPKRIRIAYRASNGVGDNGSSAMQGAGEKRTELYRRTERGVSQPATQQRAEKSGRVSSSAAKQDGLPIVILPLFHPAAALYNGGMRQTLIDDFMNIPIILNKLNNSVNKEAINA